MAIYHASTKPIARSTGRSAVAAAAYRAGSKLVDERTGLVHDYRRKRGVVFSEILTPDGGTAERAALWNAAERAETRKDARTAREWVIALPAELNAPERAALVGEFASTLATRYGVAADVALHQPDREGDQRNHHAHLLTTTRQVRRSPDGTLALGDKASIELSDKARRARGLESAAEEVLAIRQLWEQIANRALERAGHAARIDARSLEAQGLDQEATSHLGPAATAMERRNIPSDRGEGNRQVVAHNRERVVLAANIVDLQAERQRRERERREAEARARAEAAAREDAALMALKDAKAALLAEIPRWDDASVLAYLDQVDAQNPTAERRQACLLHDLADRLRADVERTGHAPPSLPTALFEAAALDCHGTLAARCRQAQYEQQRQIGLNALQSAVERLCATGPRTPLGESHPHQRTPLEAPEGHQRRIVNWIRGELSGMLEEIPLAAQPSEAEIEAAARRCFGPFMAQVERVAVREAQQQRQAAIAAERQREAQENAQRQRQQEAERQALSSADIAVLEHELLEWTREYERLAQSPSSQAVWFADRWSELARAQRAATAAGQALDTLEAAYADWRQVHKLGLLLMAGLPGSQRREVPAWEQRITAARATLEQAQAALAVAQEAYNARLPAAEREARQMAEDGRRQLAVLQGRIEARASLIQRAKAAAEAHARAEAERRQREVEQRKAQEPERPQAEPPAPKQEPPKFAMPAPRPKPRYPAPGG